MNDLLRNPIVLFLAFILAIWLVFKVLKIVFSLGWLIGLALVVMFIFNAEFRANVRGFFNRIFQN